MPKRPDIQAAFKKTFTDAEQGSNIHPLRSILKDENEARVLLVAISELEPNPDQPRQHFSEEALADLAASIREKGVLQPIIARKKPDGTGCIIIAGERRWRASKAAGLTQMPVLIRDEKDALEIAIIENLQRENLSPLEEAEALVRLKEERQYKLDDLARIIGKSPQTVSESLALVKLPDDIKAEVFATSTDVRRFQKSQLLQVVRAGTQEEIRAAWDALREGESPTVRSLKKARAKTQKGRPKNFQFAYKAPSGVRVTVTFARAKASAEDVKAALREAIDHVA